MRLEFLDNMCIALTVIGDTQGFLEEYNGKPTMRVTWRGRNFLRLYDGLGIGIFCSPDKKLMEQHDRLAHNLKFAELWGRHGIVYDFFMGMDAFMRDEFIKCSTDALELQFIRFYADDKPNFRGVCVDIDRRLETLAASKQDNKL